MQKPLPPATVEALGPLAYGAIPVRLLSGRRAHPFRPANTAFDLRNT
jgi:hypothetical protein